MQKKFGFKKKYIYKNYKINHFLSFLFVLIFLLINFIYHNIILANKNDLQNSMIKLSNIYNQDSTFSQIIIDIHQLNNYIQNWQYYKLFEKDLLDNLLKNINSSKITFNNNTKNLLKKLQPYLAYKKQLYKLLYPGKKYVIILQNCWENRPLGGFFWSVALLDIYDTGFNIKFEDIYKLYYLSTWNKINLTWQRAKEVTKKNYINIIDSKILWFSNKDFKNFKILYEKATWKKIDGIISINSCFLEEISDKFKYKIYTWQFLNAAVDQIRNAITWNKKQLYLQDIYTFFTKEEPYILKTIISNIDYWIQNNYIKVYIPNIDYNFKYFLIKNKLRDIYNPNNIYFFDYNIAFNKIDRFVDKKIYIITKTGKVYTLDKNQYTFKVQNIEKIVISYSLHIPNEYKEFINKLEAKFKIKLNSKQKHILWVKSYFHNKGIILLPENLKYNWKNYIIYDIYLDQSSPYKNLTFNIKN